MKWRKARRKPTIVEFREPEPKESYGGYGMTTPLKKGETVKTLHGPTLAICGEDLIIKSPNGDLYPIRKSLFNEWYEVLADV